MLTRVLLRATLLVLLLPGVASAQTKLYAGPEAEPLYLETAPQLMTALFPDHRLNLRATTGGLETLQLVLEDPEAVGLVQRDLVHDHLARQPNEDERAVLFGNLGLRCLYAVVREGGWVASFEDLLRQPEDQPLLVDVGPAAGDAAATFAAMRNLEPGLSSVELEYRGGLRALHMVEAGLTDVAFFVEAPNLQSQLVAKVRESETLTLLPVVARSLLTARDPEDSGSSYLYTRVVVERNPWLRSERSYETLCTPLSVLVNAEGETELLDALAFAVISQEFEPQDPSLTERLLSGAQDVGDRVLRLIERF